MAQYSLGVSYEIGEGVAQDSAEAVKWCRARRRARETTMTNSASMSYDNCVGVPVELKKLPLIALCRPFAAEHI